MTFSLPHWTVVRNDVISLRNFQSASFTRSVIGILVQGTKIFNLFAENVGPGPRFSIDNPEKNGPPLKILVRGGRIHFN